MGGGGGRELEAQAFFTSFADLARTAGREELITPHGQAYKCRPLEHFCWTGRVSHWGFILHVSRAAERFKI